MTAEEAIKHLFKTLSAYKERCNSEWCNKDREALDVLTKELEKRENGLIIELPVPMGTEVWTCYDYDDWRGCVVRKDYMFSFNCLSIVSAWGNRVFATREEAEAKLKEMEEKK